VTHTPVSRIGPRPVSSVRAFPRLVQSIGPSSCGRVKKVLISRFENGRRWFPKRRSETIWRPNRDRPIAPSLERVRSEITRNRLRVAFAVLILITAAVVVSAAGGGVSTASKEDVPDAPETDNHTVVTESGRAGTITAYQPNGEVLYYNNSRTKYFDADPVEGDPLTVEYAATDTIHTEGANCGAPPCTRNVIERADLETGEVEVIYERYDYKGVRRRVARHRSHQRDPFRRRRHGRRPGVHRQHRDGGRQLALGRPERLPARGRPLLARDWAHINDVEYIEEGQMEGRIMASLRNQDQVVFLDREEGLLEDWTLGSETSTTSSTNSTTLISSPRVRAARPSSSPTPRTHRSRSSSARTANGPRPGSGKTIRSSGPGTQTDFRTGTR